jgi:hypothetical protein
MNPSATSEKPNIHQIFITDHAPVLLPPYFQMATDSVRKNIPHSSYKVYSNPELQAWIRQEFGGDMILAFNKLKPYAYRADLARLLLQYRYGGWYFDITIRVLNGISVEPSVDFITFNDLPHYSGATFACSNAIIYSKKNSKILETAINEALGKISSETYGKNSLDITGPLVLGRAVAQHHLTHNIISGSLVDLTPGMQNRNRAFVFNSGLIFALHKQGNRGGDLESLGAVGTNNYAKMYTDKEVFDPSINSSSSISLKSSLERS